MLAFCKRILYMQIVTEVGLIIRNGIFSSRINKTRRSYVSGNRIMVGARFFVPSRPTLSPTLPPVLSVQCIRVFFPGVKRPEFGVNHPPLYNSGLGTGRSYIFASHLCLHWHVFRWLLAISLHVLMNFSYRMNCWRQGPFPLISKSITRPESYNKSF
jgi:hypothetical protein